MARALSGQIGSIWSDRALEVAPKQNQFIGGEDAPLVGHHLVNIATVFEAGKQPVYKWMGYRPATIIGRQMTFGDIGCVLLTVDKDMVPGLVCWRQTYRHSGIPFLRSREHGVNVVNDAAVAGFEMADQLTDVIFRFLLLRCCHGISQLMVSKS